MQIFNPLDFDKWRALVADFDAKRATFFSALTELKNNAAPTPELAEERRKLLGNANLVQSSIDATMKGLQAVRNVLQSIGNIFNRNTGQTLNELGLAPILLGVTIAGVAAVISSVSLWLRSYNVYRQKAVAAGFSPEEIKAGSEGSLVRKVFGIDIRWLIGLAGLAIAGPFVFKQLEKRL